MRQNTKTCPFCAEEIKMAAIVCKHCGRDLDVTINQPAVRNNVDGTPLDVSSQKKQKKTKRKGCLWGIAIILGISILINSFSDDENGIAARHEERVSEAATAIVISKTPAPTNTPTPTSTPTPSPQDYKDEAIVPDVRELTRNTEEYLNNVVSYSGEIIQVLETDVWFSEKVIYTLRLAVNEDVDNVIIAKIGDDTGNGFRPLEDDIISIWGIVTGRETFKTVLGKQVTLPSIEVKHFELKEE